MEKQTQRKFNLVFKVNVAHEAVWNQKILAELAQEHDNNPVMISTLKAELQEDISATFEKSMDTQAVEQETRELYATIGQLKVETEFLKLLYLLHFEGRQLGKAARSWGSRYFTPLSVILYFTSLYPQKMRTFIYRLQQRILEV